MSEIQFLAVERVDASLVVALLQNVGGFAQDNFLPEWRAALEAAADPAVGTVVLSLRRLPYFGSVALEMMLQLERRLRVRGARLVLCHVSTFGREVLRIARFDRLLPVFKTVEEALAAATADSSSADASDQRRIAAV
ncbi:MAG: STAS domain-containing protein [Planctomycetota bacterium]